MSQRRRAVVALTRRRDHLSDVLRAEPNYPGSSFDRRERAALDYALGVIADADAVGLRDLGELSDEGREELRGLLELRATTA